MTEREAPDLPVVWADWPAPESVVAFTTTRKGGCSTGPWSSLNLGKRSGDDPGAVAANRKRLEAMLPARPQWLRQEHGKAVVRHPGRVDTDREGDAVVAFAPGQACAILTADCLPVAFCNRSGNKVAMAHAGWRGLAAGVLWATVAALGEQPGEILAWLGPAIGPGAYEVGAEVRSAFLESDTALAGAFSPSRKRWLLDLYRAARTQLVGMGVENVYGGGHCTLSEPDNFYSYRRDGATGRMASVIWIRS